MPCAMTHPHAGPIVPKQRNATLPGLPCRDALVEFAAALEGVMVVMIVALLARTIALTLGSTDTGEMTALRERERKP